MHDGGSSERPKIVTSRPAMCSVEEEIGSGCGMELAVEPVGDGWGVLVWREGEEGR